MKDSSRPGADSANGPACGASGGGGGISGPSPTSTAVISQASGWPQVATATSPPGRTTLASSASARPGSAAYCTELKAVARSKESSG